MSHVITLRKSIVDEMIAHAQQDDPNECCGVLAGRDGEVVKLYRVTNSEHSPYRYNMDSQEFFQVYKEIDQKDWDMIGFYHSHTHTEAYPSPTDRSLAFWPDSYYLIVSLQDKDNPRVRAFSILNGDVDEHEIRVGDG